MIVHPKTYKKTIYIIYIHLHTCIFYIHIYILFFFFFPPGGSVVTNLPAKQEM